MNLTKTLGLAFLASALLFSSCKKDDDDDTPPAVTCKLAKSVYFDQSGLREDSARFTYTGDRITKAEATDYYYTYEYAGDRVSKRNSFSTGQTTPDYFQQLSYNSDGTPSKIETFVPTSGTNSQIYDRMEFVYSGGKIQRIDYVDFSMGTGTKVAEFLYTYTGNNITTVAIRDLTVSPAETTTFTYTYDANPNYLKKQNTQIHFLDPFFGDGDPTLMPFALSENNVASLSVDGQTAAPLTYSLDDRQNIKDIKVVNRFIIAYTYQCQ